MNKTKTAPVFLIGAALLLIGLLVTGNSTDFNPDPFLGDTTNPTGQLAGVVIAASGAVVIGIGAAARAVCQALTLNQA